MFSKFRHKWRDLIWRILYGKSFKNTVVSTKLSLYEPVLKINIGTILAPGHRGLNQNNKTSEMPSLSNNKMNSQW